MRNGNVYVYEKYEYVNMTWKYEIKMEWEMCENIKGEYMNMTNNNMHMWKEWNM